MDDLAAPLGNFGRRGRLSRAHRSFRRYGRRGRDRVAIRRTLYDRFFTRYELGSTVTAVIVGLLSAILSSRPGNSPRTPYCTENEATAI
jgi:hypothetical protein